jgi:hypothetical protein
LVFPFPISKANHSTNFEIPIILSPTDLTGTPFAKLQALPKNAKPITRWTKREDAYYDVVMGIRRAINETFPDMLGA